MKVEIKQTPEAVEPRAVIYCSEIDDRVLSAAELLQRGGDVVTAYDSESIVVIKRKDLFMIRAEEGRTRLCTEKAVYDSAKPLREFESLPGFMRISKFCIINLAEIKCFDPMFSGAMQVTLKNGMKDIISRKYMPEMKRYLGL
ncbi:MAG: LytTR family transcriptional regulator DNA-binding domain-containing protein [Clostridia bacterium]|nr:LytTR family transcriptional regulator DNA-binding domain-containing protein [Clostridia bacterium]MBR5713210.1 LytTR family transcriptional regulator DNA-binding domain-containing protein [Clostridia bacterium]MBR5717523.1 LytTR family transcriptional regulator DNA-binding domain-containing protein [Clostridia bacterium]